MVFGSNDWIFGQQQISENIVVTITLVKFNNSNNFVIVQKLFSGLNQALCETKEIEICGDGRFRQNRSLTNPHVWSLVDGPKSTYMDNSSLSHIARSLLPRNGLEASLSNRVMTSAPVSFNRAAALERLGQPSLSYPKWKVQMAAVNSFGGCFNLFGS